MGARKLQLQATVGAIIAALASAAGAEAAGWGPPITIADPVDTGEQERPALVAGPHGQLAAAWSQAEGVGIALARRAGRFGVPTVVPRSGEGYGAALGIDAAGNTTVAWMHDYDCTLPGDPEEICGRIHATARLASGRFTRRRTPTSKRYDTFYPRLSVTPGGRTALWWGGLGNHGSGARVASRPGRFGRTELRNRDVQAWTFDRRGRTAQIVIQNRRSLVAFNREPGGKLRRRRVLARSADPFYAFDLGTDRHGLRSAAWERIKEGRPGRLDAPSLIVGLRTASGRLAPQTLARDPGQRSIQPAAIGTGPAGYTVAAWGLRGSGQAGFDFNYAYETQMRAAVSLPGRRFARSQLLQPRHPERPVYGLDAAAGPRSAVVAWRGTRPDGSQAVYAAHAGPYGHFGNARLLTGDSSAPMSDPAVAVDHRDNATVVWIDGLRVRAVRFGSARG